MERRKTEQRQKVKPYGNIAYAQKKFVGPTMIKQVSFFQRRKDLSPEDFRKHWRTKHADVVRRLNGLVRYVQNHALDSSSGFDGIAEVWFEDMES
ncbi:uncharacterized protein METZ01_LOCUS230385, partial [marine metagenome]